MKIKLYSCFNYLKKFNNIWLYSDPHFADEEMQYIRHNYIGDKEQVKRINSKVGKKDVIIFLGDIGDVKFIKQIKGYKILVMGNHDKGATTYLRVKTDTEDNRLFDEVYEGIVCLNDKIVLSHEPINIPFMFNIHGHDHSKWHKKDKLHLNICAEHIDYTPISLKTIMESGKLKDIQDIHRLTIEKATVKSKKEAKI